MRQLSWFYVRWMAESDNNELRVSRPTRVRTCQAGVPAALVHLLPRALFYTQYTTYERSVDECTLTYCRSKVALIPWLTSRLGASPQTHCVPFPYTHVQSPIFDDEPSNPRDPDDRCAIYRCRIWSTRFIWQLSPVHSSTFNQACPILNLNGDEDSHYG